jgi:hypothetical protein
MFHSGGDEEGVGRLPGMPDLTLREFKEVSKRELPRRLQEEIRKMNLPRVEGRPKNSWGLRNCILSRLFSGLLRPFRRIFPRLKPS